MFEVMESGQGERLGVFAMMGETRWKATRTVRNLTPGIVTLHKATQARRHRLHPQRNNPITKPIFLYYFINPRLISPTNEPTCIASLAASVSNLISNIPSSPEILSATTCLFNPPKYWGRIQS